MAEEEGEVEGYLELRDFLDGSEPFEHVLFSEVAAALQSFGEQFNEGAQVEGGLFEHCFVDHGFECFAEEGGGLAYLSGGVGDEDGQSFEGLNEQNAGLLHVLGDEVVHASDGCQAYFLAGVSEVGEDGSGDWFEVLGDLSALFEGEPDGL